MTYEFSFNTASLSYKNCRRLLKYCIQDVIDQKILIKSNF